MKRLVTIIQTSLWLFLLLVIGIQGCKKEDKLGPTVDPKIEQYYPNSGKGGTLVTIEGEGLSSLEGDVSVRFGDQLAKLISVSADAIVVQSPFDGQSGMITLETGKQNLEIGMYTYQELSIVRLFPVNGPAGSQIRISGTGFTGENAPALVTINGKQAIIVNVNDTLIIAEVPEAAGRGPVEVSVDGSQSKGQDFIYQAIHHIKPLTGGKGTRVTVTGEGFDNSIAGNIVDFNGKRAVVQEATETQLVIIAPEEVTTGPLSVVINDQKTTGPAFTVVAPPVIGTVSPLSGPAGVEMVIKGEGFSTSLEENNVLIGDVAIVPVSATTTELKMTIPQQVKSGPVAVIVNDQKTEGPSFKSQTLGILSMTPDNGLTGTTVTINGIGFSSRPEENIVTFNGVMAQVLTADENKVTVVAPEGLSTGTLKIKVGNLEAFAPTRFKRAGVLTLAGGPNSTVMDLYAGGGIVIDSHGNLFVTEIAGRRILKVAPNGQVSVFAGSGSYENKDGQGTDAGFGFVTGSIAIDSKDNLYVTTGQSVRKVTPTAVVSTITRLDQTGYQICVDPSDNIYVFKSYYGFTKITPSGQITSSSGSFNDTRGRMVVDKSGRMYKRFGYDDYTISSIQISDQNNRFIATIGNANSQDLVDGIGTSARFGFISSMVLDPKGDIYLVDNPYFAVRKINLTNNEVTTILQASEGYEDGAFDNAKFGYLRDADIAVGRDGAIYLLEAGNVGNNAIRKIFLE